MFSLLINISKVIHYAKSNGLMQTSRAIWSKQKLAWGKKISIVDRYKEYAAPDFGAVLIKDSLDKKSINWFIPPVGRGSGGHLNIFRFIRNLEALGYKSRIIVVGDPQPTSSSNVKKNIHDWFFPLEAGVYIFDGSEIPSAYFAIATEWRTAYYVKRFRSCIKKCYFVQDFEPWFYPAGTDWIFAENTYRFGFYGFTAGSWLANKLNIEYGMHTKSLGFSYDRDHYGLKKIRGNLKEAAANPKVFFYARPPTMRRGFELGILVLQQVIARLPNVIILLAGWKLDKNQIPFPFHNLGLLELNELGSIYKECDVGLVLSFSNVSLLPLELMACGVPVVSNKAPYTEWLLNENNSILADPTVESLSQAIISVLSDRGLAMRLREGGLNFSCKTSWEGEAQTMAENLERLTY